ncbi:MAG: formylglycine-generating enzyme family protein [Deltaproteobacteria bacterium]
MTGFSRGSLKLLFFLIPLAVLAGCKPSAPKDKNMVLIPRGEFIIGSDEVDAEAKALQYGSKKPWFSNERPAHKVSLDDYYMDKTEVTNRGYKEFTDATKYKLPPNWENGTYPVTMDEHPVTHVDWNDAAAFCKWKDKRLPTEAEWEKAARGTDGRRFPWGNEFDIKKVNTLGEYNGTTPIGSFPDGKSPYGLLDMAGNAWEWTADWYMPYPNNTFDDPDYGQVNKVIRGGAWGGIGHYSMPIFVRTSFRVVAKPTELYNDLGFRCAWSSK